MGWLFSASHTKQEEVHDILDSFDEGVTVRRHSLRGQHLWIIVETPTRTLIVLALLKSGGHHGGYGHKLIDETSGPGYYDCPLTWLSDVPDPETGFSTQWRQAVREQHAGKAKRRNIAPGQTWRLANGLNVSGECRITRKLKRGWEGVVDGITYRVMPRMLAERIR